MVFKEFHFFNIQNLLSKIFVLVGMLFSFSAQAEPSCLSSYQMDIVEQQFQVWSDRDKRKSQLLEKRITSASWSQIYYLGTGMTETYLVKYKGLFSGIFKPYGEFWRHKNKAKSFATNPKAEVLAFKSSELTELGHVPLTLLVEMNGMKGSLQLYIPKNEEERHLQHGAHFQELRLLDYLINNTDRRADNILHAEDFLVAIDHSQAFKVKNPSISEAELKTIIQSLTKEKRYKLSLLSSEDFLKISQDLISAEEQQALVKRFQKIKEYL